MVSLRNDIVSFWFRGHMGDSRIEPQAPVLIEPPQCGTALWSTHNMFGQKLQDKLRIIPFRLEGYFH